MMWRRLPLVLLVPLALALLLGRRSTPQAAPPPGELALLVSRGLGSETALHFVASDASNGGSLGAPVATFSHLPDAMVRGALLPGTRTVIATADRAPTRDHAFDASLLRIEPGHEAVALFDRVDHAARPLVNADGRVFIGRGRGSALTIEEIDARSGATRVWLAVDGYHASPVALHRGQLYAYVVDGAGASLRASDGSVTRVVIPELAPFARDFTLDGDVLIYANRDRHLWTIESIDLVSGARRRLYQSSSSHLAPHVWPGGDVAFDDGRGLTLLRDGRANGANGVDVVRAVSPDARLIAGWHYAPGALQPQVSIWSAAGTLAARFTPPDDRTRLEIVGFVR